MSRRGRGSSASKKFINSPPPSHPSENFREHRKFLVRSLERNDIEINALIELNKSLHRAKSRILQSCGELTLLDLGSGRLKLINGEFQEEIAATDDGTGRGKAGTTTDPEATTHHKDLTPTQKEVCVDFLLRMKLRQKLSNRLVRRLTRLAHAMDGKDVSPPHAPKYGDLRFRIDSKSIEARHKECKEKENARKRIQNAIDLGLLESDGIREISSGENEHESELEERNLDSKPISTENSGNENMKLFSGEIQSVDASTKGRVDWSSTVGADKSMDLGEKTCGQSKQPLNYYTSSALVDDFKLLEEYESAYEKTWDISTRSFQYVLANEVVDGQEYKQFTKGAGIGATTVFTNIDGLQAEYKRWKTNILRRIQEQPTSDELGLKHRVFQDKERRKRCLEEIAIKKDCIPIPSGGSPAKKKRIEDPDFKKDIEYEMKEQNSKDNESEGDGEENGESDEDEEMEGNVTNMDTMKPKRSISFAATPSFHYQDLARIRLIHRDLLNSSQAEITRKRLTDATNDYNQTHQLSTQLIDARQVVQHNLTFTIAKGRQELTKAHSDYTIAYTTAKQLWLKEKFEYDMKKSQAVLPTKWGSQPLGTELIKKYMQNNHSNVQLTTVSQTLADIVDGSILAAEGKAPIQRFKDFVPPPAPGMNAQTGENMAQRQHRVEMEYRKQYNAIDAKFHKSEAERSRAWRKVMKAQAEINSVSGSNGRGVRVTLSNYHQIPVPSIRASPQQNLPSQYAQQKAKLPSYTPPVSTSTATLTDMSKYSAAKVKKRKSADGTVAPVSEPKKTKDGLYLRPAGRTRKGMQWDAVNGVWIPQRS